MEAEEDIFAAAASINGLIGFSQAQERQVGQSGKGGKVAERGHGADFVTGGVQNLGRGGESDAFAPDAIEGGDHAAVYARRAAGNRQDRLGVCEEENGFGDLIRRSANDAGRDLDRGSGFGQKEKLSRDGMSIQEGLQVHRGQHRLIVPKTY